MCQARADRVPDQVQANVLSRDDLHLDRRWTAVSHSVPGRTDSVCMRRWKLLQRWDQSDAPPKRFHRPPPARGGGGGKRKQPGGADAQGSNPAQDTGRSGRAAGGKRKQPGAAVAQGSKPAQGTGPAATGDAAPVAAQQHGTGSAEPPSAAAESGAAVPGNAAVARARRRSLLKRGQKCRPLAASVLPMAEVA